MRHAFFTILFLLCATAFSAQTGTIAVGESFLTDKEQATLDGVESPDYISDDPVLENWDKLLTDTWAGEPAFYVDTSAMNIYDYKQYDRPVFHDSVYISRIAELDAATPFDLTYNRHVKSIIGHYTNRGRFVTARVLGLSEMYFPMMEEILEREGLPLEMKYLSVIESALKPTARSRAGATGLWQFMYGTGKEQGLQINSYIDERMDPIKSTEAACKYLKYLYGLYDDWGLALAAYNSGPGNVNKAIRRSGGKKDYWGIWEWLPRETRGYVPAFIAVNYVMNYNVEHNMFPIAPPKSYFEYDTVRVNGAYNFAQIAAFTNASVEELNWLNPQFKTGYIPTGKQHTLMLPREDIGDFILNESKIKEHETKVNPKPMATVSRSDPYSTDGLTKEYYTVRSGDVLGTIAERNGVGLSRLRSWNNIGGSRIKVGQKLVIYRDPKAKKTVTRSTTTSSSTASTTKVPQDPNARYHTIRSGDTLWDIAKLYNGVTVTDIKKWNSHLNFKRLKPGQKVRVSG